MKKNIVSLFAVLLGVGLALGTSSFKNSEIKKSKFTNYYFKYIPTSNFGESDLENSANWTALGTTPGGTDPCPGINNRVCVAHAPLADGNVATLITFLQAQTPAATGASTYMTTSANLDYLKP